MNKTFSLHCLYSIGRRKAIISKNYIIYRDIKKVERNQNGLLFLMMQTVTLFYRVVFKQQSLIHVISQCGT